jgi:hypothetical protein
MVPISQQSEGQALRLGYTGGALELVTVLAAMLVLMLVTLLGDQRVFAVIDHHRDHGRFE